ncbi:hypothetical protein D3C71_2077050 [compost metagenome]
MQFDAQAFAGLDVIEFFEDSGAPCTARWFDLAELDLEDGPALFPAGLKQVLLGNEARGPDVVANSDRKSGQP